MTKMFWLWGVFIVLVITLASGVANIWFYSSLADTTEGKWVYGAMGGGADGFKSVALIFAGVFAVYKNTKWWARGLRLGWSIAVAASAIAAIGFTSMVQANIENPKADALRDTATIEAQLSLDQAELETLMTAGEPDPPLTYQAELNALLDGAPALLTETHSQETTVRALLASKDGTICEGAFAGPVTRTYCPVIRSLEANKARSERVLELRNDIKTASEKLENIDLPASGEVEAPAYVTLSKALTWLFPTSEDAKVKTIVFFAVFVEAVSCLGFTFMNRLQPVMWTRVSDGGGLVTWMIHSCGNIIMTRDNVAAAIRENRANLLKKPSQARFTPKPEAKPKTPSPPKKEPVDLGEGAPILPANFAAPPSSEPPPPPDEAEFRKSDQPTRTTLGPRRRRSVSA